MVNAKHARAMTNEDLAKAWLKNAEAAAAQDLATNALVRQIGEGVYVYRELEKRGEAAIRHILPFLNHPIDRVRCLAAECCYPIAPERCSEVLIAISNKGGPAGMDAAMTLLMRDESATERLKTPELKRRLEEHTFFDDFDRGPKPRTKS